MTHSKLYDIVNKFSEHPITRIVNSDELSHLSNDINDICVVDVCGWDSWFGLIDKRYLLMCQFFNGALRISIYSKDYFPHKLNLVKTLKIRELE